MSKTSNLEKISNIVTKETIGFYLLTETAQKKLDADLQMVEKKYVIFYSNGNTFCFDKTDKITDGWETVAYDEKISEMITENDAAFLLRYGRKVRDFL